MTDRLLGVSAAVLILVAVSGCATGSTASSQAIAITDIRQVVGGWDGWVTGREGGTVRVQLSVQDDGRYQWQAQQGAAYTGHVRMVDGACRFGLLFPRGWDWGGTLTLAEAAGNQYLTWRRNDGTVLAEFTRAK
jgi:hypothetical protein